VPAVKLFAFFGEVGPAGGGTLLLAGSHRLVDRYRPTLPPGTGGNLTTWGRFLRQDRWLDQVRKGGNADDPKRELVSEGHDVGGIPVRLVELTGEPGDVVITHIHTFHCGAPNTSTRPRQMLGGFVRRAP
jgi:ectoine hydroxylase-related dioxygenase (phytanoyl-CoA dioxygenase family)